jgi:benzoylformate decarboxylase
MSSDSTAPAGPSRWTRDYVFDILRELGIHYIFGVPGTNEIPIIDGTSIESNQVSYIECLHENIAIGAAMGSARMTGKPGVLVVHVTPGIGHSLGNLFNAHRSRVPLVILCCQQHNELVTQEPLLASDLVQVARQYTKWAHEVRSWEEFGLVLQRAFKEAMAPPTGPVFVAIPWEFTIHEIPEDDHIDGVTRIAQHFTGDPAAIREAADLLAKSKHPVIIAGDSVGYADAWPELQELARLLGAPVLLESLSSVANFPNRDPHWQGELPTTQAGMQQVLAKHDVAFLCGFGNQAQVTVFKYSDGPLLPKTLKKIYLANSTWDIGKNYFGEPAIFGDIKATLPLLNERVAKHRPEGAEERNLELKKLSETRWNQWMTYADLALEQKEIWAVLAANALRELIAEYKLEKRFVYVHEAISDPAPFQMLLPLDGAGGAPISYYCVAGGSLGWSMPASLGIKLEAEGHQGIKTDLVVNAVGDGSSLFYPQVWWTAAHRSLNVLYIITNNQEYHTLQVGLGQVVASYGSTPGYGWHPQTMDPDYLRIHRPTFDFPQLAKAFGVPDGMVVTDPKAVKAAIKTGMDHVLGKKGSYVLDLRTAQSPPAPPPTADAKTVQAARQARQEQYFARYAAQPPLDIYHHRGGATQESVGAGAAGQLPANVSVIF